MCRRCNHHKEAAYLRGPTLALVRFCGNTFRNRTRARVMRNITQSWMNVLICLRENVDGETVFVSPLSESDFGQGQVGLFALFAWLLRKGRSRNALHVLRSLRITQKLTCFRGNLCRRRFILGHNITSLYCDVSGVAPHVIVKPKPWTHLSSGYTPLFARLTYPEKSYHASCYGEKPEIQIREMRNTRRFLPHVVGRI